MSALGPGIEAAGEGMRKLLAAIGGEVDHDADHVCVIGPDSVRWDEDPVVLARPDWLVGRCPRCGVIA